MGFYITIPPGGLTKPQVTGGGSYAYRVTKTDGNEPVWATNPGIAKTAYRNGS